MSEEETPVQTPPQEPVPPRSEGTTITGIQLLTGIIFIPVVMVWLALGATALAVLSLPVSMGLGKLFEAFSSEVQSRNDK